MQIVVGVELLRCGGQFSDDRRRPGIMSMCFSNHCLTGDLPEYATLSSTVYH